MAPKIVYPKPPSAERKGFRTPPRSRQRHTSILDVMTVDSIKRGIEHAQKVKGLVVDVNVVEWDLRIAERHEEVKQALITSCRPFQFKRWQRAISYKYSTAPLSCVGSLRSATGGRFNVGSCDPERFEPFPALYVAEDRETAWAEKYGVARKNCGLTAEELSLTTKESVSYVSVSGEVERVIDLRDHLALSAFVNILKGFKPSTNLVARGKDLGMVVEYPSTLKKLLFVLLYRNWRGFPTNFDIPSPSQRFGELAQAAGVCGIVYPSVKKSDGSVCLVVFPRNVKETSSTVSVDDPCPALATHTHLDSESHREFLGL